MPLTEVVSATYGAPYTAAVQRPRRSWPNRLKRVLAPVVDLMVYPLGGLMPRSPRQWAFGHIGGEFAGNPKFLFLWMTIHRPDLRATWITGNPRTARMLVASGYRARRRWSAGGMLAALRARIFVTAHGIDNVNVQLGKGAMLVNLWHGVGLKAIQFGDPNGAVSRARTLAGGSPRRRARLRHYLTPPAMLATTSDFMQAHFAAQFELPPERCPQLGYPRLDCATDAQVAAAARAIDIRAGFRWNAEGFAETYLYLPTFRDSARAFLSEALPDPARLSEVLKARDAVLYVKLHPRTADRVDDHFDRIRRWPDDVDFQTYLGEVTGLITDYSSVLYDYLYLRDGGALLYTFDAAEYFARDRSLLYPFDENIAGLRVSTFDALCEAIRTGAAFDPALHANVAAIRQRFWGGSPRPASAAIVAHVEGQVR